MQSIVNWLRTNKFPLLAFFIWRFTLGLLVYLFAYFSLPLRPTFPYYLSELAWRYPRSLSTFAFFDGIHYLRIARLGYIDTGPQAFFPLYPFLIRLFSPFFPTLLHSALFFSSFFTLSALLLIWHTFPRSLASKIILLLLTFPTSFFFIAVYSEGLFLFQVALWLFFLAKYYRSSHRRYLFFLALTSGLATLTRITGLGLSLATLYLIITSSSRRSLPTSLFLALLSFSGLLVYMLYLWFQFHDPLMFFHVQSMFGAHRSSQTIILPFQTLWRYLKIIFTAQPTTFLYLRSLFELLTFLWGLFLLYKFFLSFSHKLPQLIFTTTMLFLPSLTGTLSSFPRYFLPLMPLFAIWARLFSSSKLFFITLFVLLLLQLTLFTLFSMGYFIA